MVLEPVDRAIERPSDRVIELAHALLLAGVGAACPAPPRVRAWQFVGVAGNRSRVVLLLLGQLGGALGPRAGAMAQLEGCVGWMAVFPVFGG